MIMSVKIEDVYRQIGEIAQQNNVEKILLFGSRARGDHTEKSDIDLAVYGCKDFAQLCDQLNEELWSLLELDIIDMDSKYLSQDLVDQIDRDGVVIYEKI